MTNTLDSKLFFNDRYLMTPPQHKSFLKSMKEHRYTSYRKEISKNDKARALAGSVIGTVLPMVLIAKHQKVKNPFKINYGIKEIILMSASSIIGGVGFGVIGEEKDVRDDKLKEGFFQFMNASVPTWISGGTIGICEKSKKLNNIPCKILSLLSGLLVGMYGAAGISNIITDPKDKYPDRKLSIIDGLANFDDVLGALMLAKFPLVEKLNVKYILPFIYAACGYRAGESN